MKVTRFRPMGELIIVGGRIWGPRGSETLRLAFDTAASETLIRPSVIARLGYGAADAIRTTVVRSAIGEERGQLLRVAQFSALGYRLTDHLVHAHELPGHYDLDGLLGLRFLHHFDYTVLSRRGELRVELATSA